MSDPRYTDPRYTDPRYSDAWNRNAMLSDEPFGRAARWTLGLCVMVLTAAIIIAGLYLNPNRDTGSDYRAPVTNHSMPMTSPQPPTHPPRQ
jgi:hypothetical protein